MIFTKTSLHVMAGAKKTDILRQVETTCSDMGITLVLHPKPKKEDGTPQMQELIDILRGSANQAVVGSLPKEKGITGAVPETWSRLIGASTLQVVDIAPGLGEVMAMKDEEEITCVKKAAYLASSAMNFAVKQVEDIIDQEKKVKHSKLAALLESAISDPSNKLNIRLKADAVDLAYPPVFQSGGSYDIKYWSRTSSEEALSHQGVILCSLGARYSQYCANVSRTLLVDPSTTQQAEYAAIAAAQSAAIGALVEGAKMSAAYNAAVSALKDKGQEQLIEQLPKNVGTCIGLELKDTTIPLSATNEKTVAANMAFNVSLGIGDLTREDSSDEATKTYAILLSDTVIVKAGGGEPDVITMASSKDWNDIAYFLGDEDGADEDEEAEEESEGEDNVGGEEAVPSRVAVRKSARTEQVDFRQREEERRRQKEAQEGLLERANQATLQLLTKNGAAGQGSAGVRKISDLVAYKASTDVQHNNTLTVQVDHRNECLLMPIYGVLVPFHILTVKNATNNQDGDYAYIRINFNYGGSYDPSLKYPSSIFLKELSFRTADVRHAAKVVQEIKTLRSSVQQRDKEKAERATLVQQEKLVRAKGRVFTLPDVWARPALGGKGRKVTGTLEAHINGFRYTSPKGDELDIMYRNIKHAFFQPAENEMMTLVHFHLHNPIMVGKKKTADVQFYTEVMDAVQTLDAGRRSMYDPDEIEEEQRERERRNQINRQFSQFVKRVQQDIWERDFG